MSAAQRFATVEREPTQPRDTGIRAGCAFDDELELRWLLNRQVAGVGTLHGLGGTTRSSFDACALNVALMPVKET
jgi:hypothetical protein